MLLFLFCSMRIPAPTNLALSSVHPICFSHHPESFIVSQRAKLLKEEDKESGDKKTITSLAKSTDRCYFLTASLHRSRTAVAPLEGFKIFLQFPSTYPERRQRGCFDIGEDDANNPSQRDLDQDYGRNENGSSGLSSVPQNVLTEHKKHLSGSFVPDKKVVTDGDRKLVYLCNYLVIRKIPLVMAGRRPGDPEIFYVSAEKAERELKWTAKYGIEEMCRDQWNWTSNNPYGYESQPQESTN